MRFRAQNPASTSVCGILRHGQSHPAPDIPPATCHCTAVRHPQHGARLDRAKNSSQRPTQAQARHRHAPAPATGTHHQHAWLQAQAAPHARASFAPAYHCPRRTAAHPTAHSNTQLRGLPLHHMAVDHSRPACTHAWAPPPPHMHRAAPRRCQALRAAARATSPRWERPQERELLRDDAILELGADVGETVVAPMAVRGLQCVPHSQPQAAVVRAAVQHGKARHSVSKSSAA
jgi:hypothetical protein